MNKAMVDSSKLVSVHKLRPGVSDVGMDVVDLAHEATAFLESHAWCGKVEGLYYDRGFPKVSVFLAEIAPKMSAPGQVWVIVGDVPPLYLDTTDYENGAEALAGYVFLFLLVLRQYRSGKSIDGLPPVLKAGSFVPLSLDADLADMIQVRVEHILRQTLEFWKDEIPADLSGLTAENVEEYL